MNIYTENNRPKNQKTVRGIIVNPTLRDGFDNTDNEQRDSLEWDDWYCLTYVVGEGDNWQIRCLDGGAWDRSTLRGFSGTMNGAIDQVLELIEKHNS